jgi:hypothetical protein
VTREEDEHSAVGRGREIEREPGGRAPFSLVFLGGPNPPLPQRIYRVEHDRLGVMEIFLVPIAADRYQAVFT